MLSLFRVRNSFSQLERVWLMGGGRSLREGEGRCGTLGWGRGWNGIWSGEVGGMAVWEEGVAMGGWACWEVGVVVVAGGWGCWQSSPSLTIYSAHPKTCGQTDLN